ncbi:MAG: bacillithiol biosynthesis cysteine-adding enzyme BshC [Chitinophagales bacterium]
MTSNPTTLALVNTKKHLLDFEKTGYFSGLIVDYLSGKESLQEFYKYPFELSAFEEVIKNTVSKSYDRENLQRVFEKQYADLNYTSKVAENIASISDSNTFTVITGHQTNLFTGPLYFVHKILSVIALSEQLNEKYPDTHVVPVYWMGSEDHDFAEINHINLFNKKLIWENAKGEEAAMGRIPTESLQGVFEELKAILGDSDHAIETLELIKRAYIEQPTLGKATQYIVNELFGKYGLLVIDQDDADLRKTFVPIIEEELLKRPSKDLVEATNAKLEAKGYHGQAFVRDINFFYLTDELRQRIEWNEATALFEVVDTDIRFTEAQILTEVKAHPERFSPNVILRPVYQQKTIPCLAYIGGGGELAYWMQLQGVFDHYEVNYPMLVLRNSVLWVDKGNAKRMRKSGLDIVNLFRNTEKLVVEYVRENSENQLNVYAEKQRVECAFESILKKAKAIDQSLQSAVVGEMKKTVNALERLESKLLRAEKRNFDNATNQIRLLKNKLFPSDSLQERKDNLIAFHFKYGDAFIETLKENMDSPLDKKFMVLVED